MESIEKEYVKYVHVFPFMSPKQLKEFYKKMDLLILPSHFDVSPTVVMEGLLQGKGTLISPNVGWVSVYNNYGSRKWITGFNHQKIVIKKIKKLLREAPPEKLIEYIKKQHEPLGIFRKYLDLFSSLIE